MGRFHLVTDSRGHHLDNRLFHFISCVTIIPGLSFRTLLNNFDFHLPKFDFTPDTEYVYLALGVLDTVSKVGGRGFFLNADHRVQDTEEHVFNPFFNNMSKIFEYVEGVERFFFNLNIIPVFCTTFPMSLFTYNHRHQHQFSSQLRNQNHYVEMQRQHEALVFEMNKYLVSKNIGRQLSTPLLDRIYKNRCRNSANQEERWESWRFNKLWDGLHVRADDVGKWVKAIDGAVERQDT